MIKKKLNILLLLLLVLLFTSSLGTTCYARDLTANDIKNFIYNYCIFYGYTGEQAEAFVSNFETLPNANDSSTLEIDRWLNIANNLYPNQWALIGANNRIIIWRYGGSETNMRNYKPYMYDNYLYVNISFLNVWKTQWYISTDSTLTTTYSQGDAHQNLTPNNKFFYTDCGIYSNSSNGNLVYAAGYMTPNDLFSGPYGADYFTFLLSSTLQTFTINGDSVPYFNFNSNTANDYHLGMLGLAEYYDYAELFEYRYKFGQWKLNKITRIDNIGPVEQNLISVDLPR